MRGKKLAVEKSKLDKPQSYAITIFMSSYQETTVDVCENVVFTPFQAVCVITFTIIGSSNVMFPICFPKSIYLRNWTPVLKVIIVSLNGSKLHFSKPYQSRNNTVSTSIICSSIISFRLGQVYLSTRWPWSIHRIFWHHPGFNVSLLELQFNWIWENTKLQAITNHPSASLQ